MYTEHFGLNELPFSISPDPRYLYLSDQHREALAHLVYGTRTDGGFILLTGEVGTGKTTVCRCLLEQMPADADIAFILNPRMTAEELLATFCDELGVEYPEGNGSIKIFVDRINAYLLDANARGRKTILIIEEAQNLNPDVLEQIRLLTNLETSRRKLLQIIMIGQPELREILSRPDMLQLSQRITARYHIGPLSETDVDLYINHRLTVAGATRIIFHDSCIRMLHRLSRGIPRMINVICDRAMLGAYVEGKQLVDKRTLKKAALEATGKKSILRMPKLRVRLILTVLLLSVFGTALATVVYNHKASISVPGGINNRERAVKTFRTESLQWPEELPVSRSRNISFEALFGQWNIPYRMESGSTACQQAESRGLRCLTGRGGLNDLLRLNKPAVLSLYDDRGGLFYAALTAFDGNTATFSVGRATKTVGADEIRKRWYGDYTILWKPPENFRSGIKPGYSGPEVEWLDRRLSVFDGKKRQPGDNYTFDGELLKRLKKFQMSEGLVPDGIAGPETFIHLDDEKGASGPVLAKKGDDK
jgi:general secretion pathway protein A